MKGASVKPISVNATLDLEVRYSHVYDNILLIYCSKTLYNFMVQTMRLNTRFLRLTGLDLIKRENISFAWSV